MLGVVLFDEWIVCVEDVVELVFWYLYLVKLVVWCVNVEGIGEVIVC